MNESTPLLRFALPKGRIEEGVFRLLEDSGIRVRMDPRGYRPELSIPRTVCKVLKPQSIVEMLHEGTRDLGFTGADWVRELNSDVVELLDLELSPVSIVAAAPSSLLDHGRLPARPLVVASEYQRLAARWIESAGIEGRILRSYGATEALPPEDCDVIVDNTATGSTLKANGLTVIAEIMKSSTRLYASRRSLDNRDVRGRIEEVVLLLRSVLDARTRVMVELNVAAKDLERVIAKLPCMRKPTLARLYGEDAYAVKAAVPRSALAALVPDLKASGGSDIVVYELSQIVP